MKYSVNRMIGISIIFLILIEFSQCTTCLYKNLGEFPDKVFSYNAFWGCYNGFSDSLYLDERIKETKCILLHENATYSVPGIKFNNVCLPFDWKDPIIQNMVRTSFRNQGVYDKWERCCQNAVNCCNEMINLYNNSKKDAENCPAMWDGWSCFEPTSPERKIKKACPSYAYNGKEPSCDFYISKKCLVDQTWEDTDYSQCNDSSRMLPRTHWFIIILAISLSFCLPVFILTIASKSLHTNKMYLIFYVICSIMVRDIITLLSKIIVIRDGSNIGEIIEQSNNWPCQLMAFLIRLADNFVLVCLFWLGIYLYRKLKTPSSVKVVMRRVVVIGILLSVGSAFAWGAVKLSTQRDTCWTNDNSSYKWIIFAVQLFLLVLTVHVLFRTLCYASKNVEDNKDDDSLGKSAKATAYCIPLFLVSSLMQACTSEQDSCNWEQFFYFILYTLQGLQGILFSYLCFYNDPKVKSLVLKFTYALASKCKACTKSARKKFIRPRDPETPELPLDDHKRFSIDIQNPFSRKSIQSCSISSSVNRDETYSWDEIVCKARNSITETSDIAPTPMKRYSKRPSVKDIVMKATVALKKDVPVCEPVKPCQSSPDVEKRRVTMKDIVLRATRESISKDVLPGDRRMSKDDKRVSKEDRRVSKDVSTGAKRKTSFGNRLDTSKPMTPPLPKIIPDEILDDIQLFNYYYQNLDKILINDKEPTNIPSVAEISSTSSSRSDLSEGSRGKMKRHTSMEVKPTFRAEDKSNIKRMHSYDSGSTSRIIDVDESPPSLSLESIV